MDSTTWASGYTLVYLHWSCISIATTFTNCTLIRSSGIAQDMPALAVATGCFCALHYLKQDPDTYRQPEQPIPEVLIELIDIVLKNNVNYYLQIATRNSNGHQDGARLC